jgi:2-polyprenyl-6-methoxyphenol hydroxylase-like FAD-dependent oxidoreductase
MSSELSAITWDIIIVGAGPVGQTLAALIGQSGHTALVIEKQKTPYGLPRAVHYTPDVSRLLDQLGLTSSVASFAHEATVYEWQNAARQTLLQFGPSPRDDQGWPWSTMFNQPGLERELLNALGDVPSVSVSWGTEFVGLSRHPEHITVDVIIDGTPAQLTTSFVVGCDGANSPVRDALGVQVNNLGFFYDWLVVDVIEHEPRVWEPENLQVCDPARPTSSVSSGPGKRRLEFMRMDDDAADFVSEESCWRLLEPWGLTPHNASLERFALYTFQSRWAATWYDDRVAIAGDAAHQVPPFFGVGMVSGMRDATNLAWKLNAVLRGDAGLGMLETYTSERIVEVQNAIGMSVELGKVICELDPEKVAGRDAHFLAAGPNPANALPPVPPERLGAGILLEENPLDAPFTGAFSANGLLRDADGETMLLDQLNYGGFTLIADASRVSQEQLKRAASVTGVPSNLQVIALVSSANARSGLELTSFSAATKVVVDVSGQLLGRLDAAGASCEIIRPDFVVFGDANNPIELVTALVSRLKNAN